MTEIKCGTIYKFTSPSGKVYIGQTTRPVEIRWKSYERMECENQPRLYNSFMKYGYENHVKEVIITGITSKEMLDWYEIFYIAIYDSTGENGLNCTIGGEGRFIPEEKLKYGERQSVNPLGWHIAKMMSKCTCFMEHFPTVLSVITNEPTTLKEIANKVGISESDVWWIIRVNESLSYGRKGCVHIRHTRMRDENGCDALAYYISSSSPEENKRANGKRVGKLTKAECPNKGNHGNFLSDEELIERAKGTGWTATNARRALKKRAEKRACGSNG